MSGISQEGRGVAKDRLYSDRYVILAIVLAGVFMGVLDGTVVSVAMPTMTSFFNVDVSQSQWIVTAYLATMTGMLLVFGRLSGHTGKARMFIWGFAIFTASSFLCGLSHDIVTLIIWRVVQGLGAAMVFSMSAAIIVSAFPEHERGKALGLMATTVALGGIVSPVLGGLIVEVCGWPCVFFINVPIGIVLITSAIVYLKLPEPEAKRLDIDWPGAFFLVVALTALMLLIGRLASPSPAMVLYFIAFVASSAMLVLWKHDRPIIDLSIFRRRQFTLASLSTLIFFIALFMYTFTMPFYLEIVAGYSPAGVGLSLIVMPAMVAIVSPVSGWLYDRFAWRYHSAAGMLAMALSLAGIAYFAYLKMPMPMLACFGAFGLGSGVFQGPNTVEVMSGLPERQSGIASGVLATVRNLGMATGVSLASAILSYVIASAGADIASLLPAAALSGATAAVLLIAAALCGLGAICSWLRH